MSNFERKLMLDMLRINGLYLEHVPSALQSEDICKTAVMQNGEALKYVRSQTRDVCLAAVSHQGNALPFVRRQTNEICKASVEKFPMSLVYVENQTEEICMIAVKGDVLALDYVKELTDDILKQGRETLLAKFDESSTHMNVDNVKDYVNQYMIPYEQRMEKQRVNKDRVSNLSSEFHDALDDGTKLDLNDEPSF